MKNLVVVIALVIGYSNAFAQAKEVDLKTGQSVVVCAADDKDSRERRDVSGRLELNGILLQTEFSVLAGYNGSTKVTVKAPFATSAPTIAQTKNGFSSGRDYENTYTYCVTVTKQ